MRAKRYVLVSAAVLAAGAGGGAALAATSGDDEHHKTEQAVIDDAAKRLNVTPEALRSALGAAEDAQLDQAVKDGKLTQAQADAIKKRRQQAGSVLGGPGLGPRGGPGPGGPRLGFKLGRGGALDAAASALGLKVDDLLSKLRDGKSVADVAKEQGKSLDDVKKAITDGVTEELDKAVDEKKLTSAQRDRILAELEDHLDDLVTRTLPKAGERFGGPGAPLGGLAGPRHRWR
ncbi:MAG TPA: hypothetical protein VNT03_04180 [Baekduia sp.]|nr:hypothetical protein [Baekduia sp.]